MNDSTIGEQARILAGNVASLWNGSGDVLERISQAAGDPGGCPWAAIRRLGSDGVERLFATDGARQDLEQAVRRLTRYLTAETWFDRAVREDPRLEDFKRGPVAYFCAEFGLASWLPIYSGGLGVLAGDILKESSDMGLPFVGVGLFYRHGFFNQRLDDSGYQIEDYPTLNPADLPLTPAVDAQGKEIVVSVPIVDRTVWARVWRLQVGRTPLYLLDTDVAANERLEDRGITGGLYAGGQDTRIQQEIVLGIGGVRALRALGIEPSIFSMNEGHAAFLGVELLADRAPGTDLSPALAENRSRIVYTNHTVVPAGNDVFPNDLVRTYLGPYVDERGIGIDRLLGLAAQGAGGGFSMTVLAFTVAGKANAVSELHSAVIPREWPGFEVEAVTNGVHVPTWTGNEIQRLLDTYVPDWRGDTPSWDAIQSIPDEELLQAHSRQRRAMIDFVNQAQGRVRLDPDALTLVWARRFAEYKRSGLLASDLSRLARILGDPARPVQLVISGKAHPRDEGAKRILQELLWRLEGDERIAPRVAFIPDYSIGVARSLVGGADVWVNTPRKPLEASGTSGMKASDNGVLQLTVQDGWAAEVNWWDVGWGIEGRDDGADADQLYHFLEEDIVPTFYHRDETGIATRWAAMMKNTMIVTLSRYSARRMLLDYLHKLYLPLLDQQTEAASGAPATVADPVPEV